MTKVFVSYSWDIEKKTGIVDELEKLCPLRGIELVRDNKSLKHGDSIKVFMNEIAQGGHVITVFSDPYFRSPWCMYELLRLYQRGEFSKRTQAIIASEDCKIHSSDYRLGLVNYWEEMFRSEDEKLKPHKPQKVIEEYKKLKIYEEIQENINEILNFADDRVTTQLKDLQKDNYAQLLDRIKPLPRQPVKLDPATFTPDVVAAWIDRKPQWEKHIIERIETKPDSEKALAFIISGVEEEWPEALKLRIKCHFGIPPKKNSEIQPRFAGKYEDRKECGLWYSILEKILPKEDLKNLQMHNYEAKLVNELSKSPQPHCFFWTIKKEDAKKQLDCNFLKDLTRRWEQLALNDAVADHYLVIFYSFEAMKWHRGGMRKIAAWQGNMRHKLGEMKGNPKMLVPDLTPPTKKDLDEWINLYHPEKSVDEKKQLVKTIGKKMWWGKAPHLTILNAYLKL